MSERAAAAEGWAFPDLAGHGVRLVKAEASHVATLFAATPPDTFKYYTVWPREWALGSFAAFFDDLRGHAKHHTFVVFDEARDAIVGSTTFMDIDPSNRSVEIGSTWYASSARGTHVNPACKFLMLRHAFETLDCVRVTIKCNALNLQSQAAIRKLGAACEGVLRRHRVQQDNRTRDTMYFSVIRNEWPRVREGLVARLARYMEVLDREGYKQP